MQFDSDGLIVTLQGDGGDTCAEEGRFWFLVWFNAVFMSNQNAVPKSAARSLTDEQVMDLLECDWGGEYVRNPISYPNPKTVSRDQLLPIIYYCAAYKDYSRLKRLFLMTLKRLMFAQNELNSDGSGNPKIPDFMGFNLGDFIRCGGWHTAIFYPLLYIFDTIILLGNLVWLLFPYTIPTSAVWNNPSTWFLGRSLGDTDDNNTDIGILAAVAFKPTLISLLNRLIWGQFRPKNMGNLKGLSDNNCLAAIAWYHDPANGGNVEVIKLYKAPILKYLKKIL